VRNARENRESKVERERNKFCSWLFYKQTKIKGWGNKKFGIDFGVSGVLLIACRVILEKKILKIFKKWKDFFSNFHFRATKADGWGFCDNSLPSYSNKKNLENFQKVSIFFRINLRLSRH